MIQVPLRIGLIIDHNTSKMIFQKSYPYNLIDDIMQGENYDSELSDAELIQEVETAIDNLFTVSAFKKGSHKRTQAVLRLLYADGLSYREIAELLGVTKSRIGQIRQRAIRILRHPSRMIRLLI